MNIRQRPYIQSRIWRKVVTIIPQDKGFKLRLECKHIAMSPKNRAGAIICRTCERMLDFSTFKQSSGTSSEQIIQEARTLLNEKLGLVEKN